MVIQGQRSHYALELLVNPSFLFFDDLGVGFIDEGVPKWAPEPGGRAIMVVKNMESIAFTKLFVGSCV
jgi:hypothetical protein